MSDTHAETVAFVRDTMLEQKAPPVTLVGPIGWARTNLFSGPFNTIVSVISIVFVAWILSLILPWIFSPTWNATSLTECREIVGGAHGGACWGVIRERWLQLMFGFYPPELYWRPILTFVLLLVALAPVLFTGMPKKLLWFSAAFPFLGVWLLWGGTIWTPLSVAFGFVLGFLVIRFASKLTGPLIGMILGVVAALLWWSVLAIPVGQDLGQLIPIGLRSVTSREFGGFMLSITIGVTAIGVSLPLGIVLALGRQSDLFIVKSLCVGFIEFIRGVPLITLLFVASTLLNIFLPPGTTFDIILRVMIMVTLFAAAYMAEVVRGGLAALPKGQYEAADALGLDYWKAQRLIIMPQALKISIPGIVSTFIGVFKDTTLVSIIGLLDPLGLSTAIRADAAWNGIVWEIYGFIALMFFVFCFSMSRYSMFLERKLQTGHH
ncbi:amino acid ABC transporter permease [Pacificitalea manganoxidans]|uniref:Amino acid ABC transporter permease n=1 Tax=Pacificitalea manganoxidans TaxID=1411902 RepID=A0A291M294_9RHOB|nr:amino acid ABC transporter permease [Pacificitalea manganoxidans]ATI42908.1 amino acid ABC transporter permease [Pacificitalea manganoxidans]MAQ45568.1 amino acid ABC transporter permease [Actibacterium sp.]MDR6307174.1 general L-amino acid transport system permease protein [Pacificitalea manganoxidans]OWU67155.1 amino acid ABC transporter permease [Roseovarius sp. 22II1-1F6A]|tara:strand:- start:932 stop:2236 length:1305 start_codon:yes stop_codon:yes gene_type:complete